MFKGNEKQQDELLNHYSARYVSGDAREVKHIRIRRYPLDRYEAALYWSGSGENFLEIGCGYGNVLLALRNNYKKCVAIEFSTTIADRLKKQFSDYVNISILSGNIENKDFCLEENCFDTILMNAVLEHLVEPISTLKYIYGLLKPGGRVVIITPNIAKWTRRIKLVFGRFPSTGSLNEGLTEHDKKTKTVLYDEGRLHYFTFRSLQKILFERIHFSKVFCRSFGTPRIFTYLFPNLFSEILIVAIK